jgi:uncharacterized delta-60 repeat protein
MDGSRTDAGARDATSADAADATPSPPSGTLDPTFGDGGVVVTSLAGTPTAVAVQTDERIVVAGVSSGAFWDDFLIARFLPNGSLDPAFGCPSGDGGAEAGDQDADNEDSGDDGGAGCAGGVIGVHPFDPNANDSAGAVAIDPLGRILVAGTSSYSIGTSPSEPSQFVLLRLLPDGRLDTSFGPFSEVPNGTLVGMALQSDGRIVLAGSNVGSIVVVRHNPDGSLDPTFGSGGIASQPLQSPTLTTVSGMAVQPDGSVLVGAWVNDGGQTLVWRFHSDGSPDPSFGNAGVAVIGSTVTAVPFGMGLQPDDKIVLAESVANGLGLYLGAQRLLSSGLVDTSFGVGGTAADTPGGARAVLVEPSGGTLVVAGSEGEAMTLVGLTPAGTLNAAFGSGGRARIVASPAPSVAGAQATAETFQGDGKIVAVGSVPNAAQPQDSFMVVTRLFP